MRGGRGGELCKIFYYNIILRFYHLFKPVLMKCINALQLAPIFCVFSNIVVTTHQKNFKIQFRKHVVFLDFSERGPPFFLGYPTPSTHPVKSHVPCLTSSVNFLATALANSIILACRQRSIVCWLISSVSTMMLREFPRDCIDDVKIWSTREQTKWVLRWCSCEMVERKEQTVIVHV